MDKSPQTMVDSGQWTVDYQPMDSIAQEFNLIQIAVQYLFYQLLTKMIVDYKANDKEYKSGKNGIVGMFMGEIVKRSKGKANPKVANKLLLKKLEEV